MILTIDIGSSDIKTARIDENYEVHNPLTFETPDLSELDSVIDDLIKESISDVVGIATGFAFSREGDLFSVDQQGTRRTILNVGSATLYNDAEAAAIILNFDAGRRVIQPGHSTTRDVSQALVYLGTGFQFVPTTWKDGIAIPHYTLGCLMHAAGNVIWGKRRTDLATVLGIEERQLRMSHLISARGLCAIHQVVSGRAATPREVIDSGDAETFQEYSRILGRALQAMACGTSAWGGLVIGGTFASGISQHLDDDAIKAEFNNVGSVFKAAVSAIPISVVEGRYATNRAIAFGIRNGIVSATYAQ